MGNVIKMEEYYQYGRIYHQCGGNWSIWRNINNMGEYHQYGKISSIWGNIINNIYQQHQQPRFVKMRESLRQSARHMIIVISQKVFHLSSQFPSSPVFLLVSPLALFFHTTIHHCVPSCVSPSVSICSFIEDRCRQPSACHSLMLFNQLALTPCE